MFYIMVAEYSVQTNLCLKEHNEPSEEKMLIWVTINNDESLSPKIEGFLRYCLST